MQKPSRSHISINKEKKVVTPPKDNNPNSVHSNVPVKPTNVKIPKITQSLDQRNECLIDATIVKREKKVNESSNLDHQKLEDAIKLRIDSRYANIQRMSKAQKIPVMFTLKADEIDFEKERLGLDLVLVIDVSSSMQGQKIKLVKETLLFIVGELEPVDRVSLVKFNTQGTIINGLIPMTKENKDFLRSLIEEHVVAQTCTNINAGIRDAFDVLLARKEVNEITSIFFLSDGSDTCGNNSTDIVNLIKYYDAQMNLKNMDYKINSFGYGNDHDEEVLCSMSAHKNGSFFYIKDLKLVDECFIECLGNLISIFARNASVDVFLADDIRFVNKHGAAWQKDQEGQKATLSIGSVYAGMSKNYLCDIEVSPFTKDENILKVLVATFNFSLQGTPVIKTVEFKLNITDYEDLGEINKEVEENVNRIDAAKLLTQVEKDIEVGNMASAQVQIKEFKSKMKMNSCLDEGYVEKMEKILDEKEIRNKKYTRQVMEIVEEQSYKPGFNNLVQMKVASTNMVRKRKA